MPGAGAGHGPAQRRSTRRWPRSTLALDIYAPLRNAHVFDPKAVVDYYVDALLGGDLRQTAKQKLIDFLKDDDSPANGWDVRVREMAHAIMTTSEYQLA